MLKTKPQKLAEKIEIAGLLGPEEAAHRRRRSMTRRFHFGGVGGGGAKLQRTHSNCDI